jgi:hypothetical protein
MIRMDDYVGRELQKGERVLWSGRPDLTAVLLRATS